MAMTFWEAMDSGNGALGRESEETFAIIIQGQDPSLTGNIDDGSDDPAKVMLFALGKFSAVTASGNIIERYDRQKLAPRLWKVIASYRSQTQTRPTNDNAFTFSTTGGTQHITNSIKTRNRYAAPDKTAYDLQGAINVSDGQVGGTDIQVPVFNFKVTQYVPPAQMQSSYVTNLYKATGTINDSKIGINADGVTFSLQPGEALFMGAEGSKRIGYGDWELTMEWAASPNLTDQTIGPFTGVDIGGWDYTWTLYETDTVEGDNGGAPKLSHVPVAFYCEQVYREFDHSLITVNFKPSNDDSSLVWTSNGVLIVPGGGTVGVD